MRRCSGAGAVFGAVSVLLLLLPPIRPALAWGPDGHRVIAVMADQLLQKADPGAHAKLHKLLASDKGNKLTKNDIGSEATWADVLRQKSEEARDATSHWHATRLKPDSPNIATACFGRPPLPAGYPASHGPRDNCSVDKVLQFEAELKNPETSSFERLAALQFLLNLVGDLNDPLLAIDRGDQGGECTALQIGATPPVRLSAYWQGTLVSEAAGSDAAKGAARLIAVAPAGEAQKWTAGDPESWAMETFEIAKSVTYGFGDAKPEKYSFPPGKGTPEACQSASLYKIGPEYEAKAQAVVRTQLIKAAMRLARVLRDDLK